MTLEVFDGEDDDLASANYDDYDDDDDYDDVAAVVDAVDDEDDDYGRSDSQRDSVLMGRTMLKMEWRKKRGRRRRKRRTIWEMRRKG